MLPPPPTPRASRKTEGGRRKLTQLLEDLGQDPIVLPEGRIITRDQALAEQMWAAALGQIEVGVDEHGQISFSKPDVKLMLAIFERREGRIPQGIQDDSGRMTAEDKITEIARASINSEAEALDSLPEHAENLDVSDDGN